MFRWIFKWIIAPLLVLFLSFHLMVAGFLVLWRNTPVENSAFMLWHRLSGGDVTQSWVDYDRIAKSAKQAAIVSEDAKFVSHHGFDFDSIQAAIAANEAEGAISAGGSTISQQLAKNLFLTSHRSYLRKGEEAIITVMMESMWTKQRILEVYLNVAEFGEGIYGIEAAAQHYFKKPASRLTSLEAARLAVMLPRPRYFQQHWQSGYLSQRAQVIARRMAGTAIP